MTYRANLSAIVENLTKQSQVRQLTAAEERQLAAAKAAISEQKQSLVDPINVEPGTAGGLFAMSDIYARQPKYLAMSAVYRFTEKTNMSEADKSQFQELAAKHSYVSNPRSRLHDPAEAAAIEKELQRIIERTNANEVFASLDAQSKQALHKNLGFKTNPTPSPAPAPTPPPTPSAPASQSTPTYRHSNLNQALTKWPELEIYYGSQLGMSQSEIRGLVKQKFPAGATYNQAREYIESQFKLDQLAKVNMQRGGNGRISPSTWRRYPERRQALIADSVKYHPGEDLPAGYVRFKNESYVGSVQAGIDTSFYARHGSLIGVTDAESKLFKRTKQGGHNEQVLFQGLPTQRGFPAGPGSTTGDLFQVTRSAVTLEGSLLPPGEAGLSPSLRGTTERFTKRISVPIDQPLPSMVPVGAAWKPGANVSLAKGYSPIKTDPNAGYRVINMTDFAEGDIHGYEVAMEKTLSLTHGHPSLKFGSSKQQGTKMDLSRIRGADGRGLNLQTLQELKDMGGLAYQFYQAMGKDYTIQAVNRVLPESAHISDFSHYGEIAEHAYESFLKYDLPENTQVITSPHRMTGERLKALIESGEIPADIPGRRVAPNIYEIDREAVAFTGPLAQFGTRDYAPHRRFMSRATLKNIATYNPEFVKKAFQNPYSRKMRRAYREVINSMLLSAGTHQAPKHLDKFAPQIRNAQQIMAQTSANVADYYRSKGMTAPEHVPIEVRQAQYLKAIQNEKRMRRAELPGGGTIYRPSGRSLAMLSAEGPRLGEEVSPLVGASMQLDEALAGGTPETLKRASERMMGALTQMGAGERSIIKASGAFLPPSMMQGGILKGSDLLNPNEVFFGNLAQDNVRTAVNVFGHPEFGDEAGSPMINIPRQEAIRRGLDPDHTYASTEIAQRSGRDFDADNFYAQKIGDGAIQTGKDGYLYAPSGQRIATPEQVKAAGERAIRLGHGNLAGEMAPWVASSPESVIKGLRDKFIMRWKGNKEMENLFSEQAKLYEDIGPFYNTFRRAMATATPGGGGGLKDLFLYSHGLAQRPEKLPQELQEFHKLSGSGMSSWYGGTLEHRNKYASLSFGEARQKYLNSLTDLKTHKGDEHFLSSHQIAKMMLPEDSSRYNQLVKAIDSYRVGKATSGDVHEAAGRSNEDIAQWVTSTDTGRLYSGRAYSRRSKDTDILSSLMQAGFSEDQALAMGVSMEKSYLAQKRVTDATSKDRSYDKRTGEGAFDKAARAANAMGGFVKPLPQSQVRDAEYNAAKAAAEAEAATGGGGAGVPPIDPAAAPASPNEPGGGSGSGGGGRGRGTINVDALPDETRAKIDAGKRVPIHELVAGRVSKSMGPILARTREHLGTYSDVIQQRLESGRGIGTDPAFRKLVQDAAEVYLNSSDWEAKLTALVGDSSVPENQRTAAKHLLDNYFTTKGGDFNQGDLERAFRLWTESGATDDEIKRVQQAQARELQFRQGQRRYDALVGGQGSLANGRLLGANYASAMSADPTTVYGAAKSLRDMYDAENGIKQLVDKRARLMSDYDAGNDAQKRALAPQINEVSESMKALKEQTTPLVAAIKEERAELKSSIKIRQEDLRATQSLISRKYGLLEKAEKNAQGLRGATTLEAQDEYERWTKQARSLAGEIGGLEESERTLRKGIGIDQGRLSGLEIPSMAGIRTGRVNPPQSVLGRIGRRLGRNYSLERVNMQAQHLALGYYMLMGPTMRWRDQYIQGQMQQGSLSAALGEQLPDSVIGAQYQQAASANFIEGLGQGADAFYSPVLNAATGLQDKYSGFAPTLGKVGSGVATALVGGMGINLLTGGALSSALSSPVGWAAGAAVAGQGLRKWGNNKADEYRHRAAQSEGWGGWAKNQLASWAYQLEAQTLSGNLGGPVGALGDRGVSMFMDWAFPDDPNKGLNPYAPAVNDFFNRATSAAGLDPYVPYVKDLLDVIGFGGGAQDDTQKPEQKSKQERLSDSLIKQIVDASKVGDKYRIDNPRAAQIGAALVTAGGYSPDQIESPEFQKFVKQVVANSLDNMLDPKAVANNIEQVAKSSGFAVGSRYQQGYLEMMGNFQTQSQLANTMTAIKSTASIADKFSLAPEQGKALAESFLQELESTGSEFKAGRRISQMLGLDQYTRSANAYAAGAPELATQDRNVPWRPKHQVQMRAIQTNRMAQDFSRSQRVGQIQIGFQERALDLENAFWDLRTKKRKEDHDFQVRQFNLTQKQMQLNMDRAEEQGKLQKKYAEENYKTNLKLFDLQTKWRFDDFDTQEARMGVQRSWQLEDFSRSRQQFNIQAGWQIEDIDRGIRYASGRQRIDLKRQKERLLQQQSWKRKDMDISEDRAAVKFGWSEDDLEKQRDRWGVMRDLQREQMEAAYEYQQSQTKFRERDIELMKESMALQADRFTTWMENYNIETPLLEAKHKLDNEQTKNKIELDKEGLDIQRKRFGEEVRMTQWRREAEDAQLQWNYAMTVGFDIARKQSEAIDKYWANIGKNIAASGQSAQTVGFGIASPEQHGFGIAPSPAQYGFGIASPVQHDFGAMIDGLFSLIGELQNTTKIVVDAEALKDSGFVTVDDFDGAYQ